MNYRKQGLKALGLSFLAVLGFMALAASGAQASGKVLVSGLTAPFTVGVTGSADDATTNDRLWVLGLNLEISCPKASVSSGLLTNAGHGSATIVFSECKSQGVNAAGALIGASCAPIPTTIEAKVLALIILHSGSNALTTAQHGTGTGSPYALFTPLDGLTFSTVKNENEECLMPEVATVKGCVVASVTTGDKVTHLIDTRNMLSLFGCELKYGNNVAHIEADANVQLANSSHGNHGGLSWGVE